MKPPATTRLTSGRRMTLVITDRQMRPSVASARPRLAPTIGIRSELIRSPMRLSTAGSRVSAAATDTTPTITAPAARLRRTLVGTRNSPSRAMTKVVPLKSTARLAVAPVMAMAASLSSPLAAFLPEAGDDEQGVVDPQGEAHAGHHVDDEDREAELLGDDGGDPEADDDRQQRHEERHQPGDHGTEHEQEDDDGDRQPEVELAVPEVA